MLLGSCFFQSFRTVKVYVTFWEKCDLISLVKTEIFWVGGVVCVKCQQVHLFLRRFAGLLQKQKQVAPFHSSSRSTKVTHLCETAPQSDAAATDATPHSLHVCAAINHVLFCCLGTWAKRNGRNQLLHWGASHPWLLLAVVPQDDSVSGNWQLLANLLSQRGGGGPAWDNDGKGECESDFDDAGVVSKLCIRELKVRNQLNCTLTQFS